MKVHTDKDIEVNEKVVKDIESKVNKHVHQLRKVAGIREKHILGDKENKLTGAIITNNSGPPLMYVLWKDHKVDFETQLQTRPVVDGNSGPLSRISELLVIILSSFMSSSESSNTCKSTEEMLRAV